MKNPALYTKTVDILVDAYFNDTLIHGNQCGCAVGNIVAANCGIKIVGSGNKINWYGSKTVWQDAAWFAKIKEYDPREKDLEYDEQKAIQQIESTGYKWYELNQIEKAFEGIDWDYKDEDKNMFNGLMAVIDALDQIHENKDESITERSKKKFNREPNAKECDATNV